ncbi:peptidoglycan D,D-transpeptidase FtsI family protein [Alteromonas sp. a30]|uniref:peptidoglycan D,D-transpeptidase FtsI family protein n=1 Tax=Alteromonas sp. a30 TaxID=2730917 RepID=UPI00227E3F70|nr:penicillin-binding transpeptidase domain-containing protein [Alteromonas sp. a30]
MAVQKKKSQAKGLQTPRLVQWRFITVLVGVCLVFVGLAVRAAYIQIVEPDMLVAQGDNRTIRTRERQVHRGLILDRNGQELAVSVPVKAIWADPKVIHENDALKDKRRWRALAEVLGQPVEEMLALVQNPERRFVYVQRQVSPAMANYVKQLKIPGLYLRNESRRFYPTGEVSAHLIGFTDVDDRGIEGIERIFNEQLSGTPDQRRIRRDAKGRQVELLSQTKGKEPSNIQLTIDQRIQSLAYRELKKGVKYLQATSGSAIVADVHSGEILAMVNSPSFNPNNRQNVSAHRIRNRAITDTFEPGSSVKPLAVIGALEFGSADQKTIINTNPGWMRLGGSLVQDSRNYGQIGLTQIIKKSSNMGTSKLALSIPKEHFIDLYHSMGLVGDTGSNMIGESSGIFHDRRRWSDFELATLSFGYGLSVTTLQLARMYSILGNGGVKVPMSIIKDQPISEFQKERVISAGTAQAVVEMMEHVVIEGGTGIKARVPGYRVAGKTGTSRKAIAGGYGEEYVNNFAGLAPVSDPQLVVVVMINEPAGDLYYAGDTAAPVFSKIMSGALQMLNIPPDGRDVSSIAAVRGANNDS